MSGNSEREVLVETNTFDYVDVNIYLYTHLKKKKKAALVCVMMILVRPDE